MNTPARTRTSAAVAALLCLTTAPLVAQSHGDNGNGKRTLTPGDYGQWERLGSSTLSPKGDWVAVSIVRVDEDAYRRNSPVFHIENLTTPLLMAQGTEDGAVDFNYLKQLETARTSLRRVGNQEDR